MRKTIDERARLTHASTWAWTWTMEQWKVRSFGLEEADQIINVSGLALAESRVYDDFT
jgi:hypothetical protein